MSKKTPRACQTGQSASIVQPPAKFLARRKRPKRQVRGRALVPRHNRSLAAKPAISSHRANHQLEGHKYIVSGVVKSDRVAYRPATTIDTLDELFSIPEFRSRLRAMLRAAFAGILNGPTEIDDEFQNVYLSMRRTITLGGCVLWPLTIAGMHVRAATCKFLRRKKQGRLITNWPGFASPREPDSYEE